MDAETLLDAWPEETRHLARELLDTHGEPDEVTATRFIWYNRDPWLELTVYREFIEHSFPIAHLDAVEGTLYFNASAKAREAVSQFNGNISFNATRHTMSLLCKNEPTILLLANYAYFICKKVITPQKARTEFAKTYASLEQGSPAIGAMRRYFKK